MNKFVDHWSIYVHSNTMKYMLYTEKQYVDKCYVM